MLTEVAEQRPRASCAQTDIACRVGGDEFAVILPESGRDDAELLADRIALAIRPRRSRRSAPLKISAGVAELRPDDTAADLFKRADQALYRAKDAGKGASSRTRIAGVKQNRSIPSATVIPVLIYPDVPGSPSLG